MKDTPSHVHESRRDFFPERYIGEGAGRLVVDWLNTHSEKRYPRDPLRRLLRASGQFRARGWSRIPNRFAPFEAGKKVDSTLRDILRGSRLAVVPRIVGATTTRWTFDWCPVGRMKPKQALAFFKLLQLAEQGLIDRVRQCERHGCGRWFYARFRHQRFDTKACQLQDFRSSPEWRRKRAEYMRNQRANERL